MQRLDALIARDPRAATVEIDRQLHAARAAGPAAHARLAALYAQKSGAQANLDLSDESAQTAASGLELATDPTDVAHVNLLRLYWYSIQDRARFAEGIAALEQVRARFGAGSAPELCLLMAQAILNYRADHLDLAISQLTRVYKSATAPEAADARVGATVFLSQVFRHIGQYDQALSLSQEALGYFEERGYTFLVAAMHFNQAKIYAAMHQYGPARLTYQRAQADAQQLGDEEGIAFAEHGLCTVEIDLGQLAAARRNCDGASAIFGRNHDTDMLKRTASSLADIERLEGHPKRALDILQQIFANNAIGVADRDLAPLYLQRARLFEVLGDYRNAASDLGAYVQMQARLVDTQRNQQLAAMHAELEMDRANERSAALARELELSNKVQQQQRLRMLWMTAGSIAAALAIGSWLWYRKLVSRARAANAERLAAIGRLTGGIAHDFNNLLTVLQQAFGLLQDRESVAADAVAQALVQQSQRATRICAEITSQLLSFSRQQNLQPQALDLGKYLHEVLPLLERAAGNAVRVRLDVQQPSPSVWADQRLLTAALLNLVSNARDAMSRGGDLTIRAATEADRRIRLDVIDEGCGMAPAVLQRAIEPFFSTKTVGSGSGLGLSMVEGFVNQSGGALKIRSEPNQGTAVSLWLPAAGAMP